MDDVYLTISRPSTVETKVKGSRFIARTALVESTDEAMARLNEIRKEEHAATHNCFALVVGAAADRIEFKYSDDGEPNGTAGRPIHDAITGNRLTNVLVVVTRYYGGTKLGTGGLARAYSEAARLALDASGVEENFITDRFSVELDFSHYDSLVKVVNRLGAQETKADFSDRVRLEIEIRRSRSDLLESEIVEISKGQAKIEKN